MSIPIWGATGPEFKSRRSDQSFTTSEKERVDTLMDTAGNRSVVHWPRAPEELCSAGLPATTALRPIEASPARRPRAFLGTYPHTPSDRRCSGGVR
jgi:hypothetical protein